MFRKKIVVQALAIAFGTLAGNLAVHTSALAQSNATGNIFGQVAAGSGNSVVIENIGTNARRTLTPDTSGRFQATALPPGRYRAQLLQGGTVVSTVEVEVLIGQGAEASFASASTLSSVQVVGRRQSIDVSSTENGTSFTARQLDSLPIARNLASIIQLAPNTTRADSRYAGGASFGGGAPSENAYYINGFPVTNPLTQLGSSELPFGAIAQAQILTGGFGAEFGRSIGGVVNLTTKSGTNQWEAGVNYSIEPDGLRSKKKNLYYPVTGAAVNAATDGTLYRRRDMDKDTEQRLGGYVGGPLIKDKLFFFFAAEQIHDHQELMNPSYASGATSSVSKFGWADRRDDTRRYLGKLDWNLTDSHRLEFTAIGDESKRREQLSGYSYATGQLNGVVAAGATYKNVSSINAPPGVGANAQILKYTGNLTESFTVTALIGQSSSKHSNVFDGYDVYNPASAIAGVDVRPNQTPSSLGTITNNQPNLDGVIVARGAEDQVKSQRLDFEYKLGSHTIRAGLDYNKLSSAGAGDLRAGGATYRYFRTTTPNTGITLGNQPGVIVASGGGFGTDGYYVRRAKLDTSTEAYSDQTAQYVEDRFQVTKDIVVIAGLRNEGYTNKNGDKETFLKIKDQLSPRLSAAWDVVGDASLKVFGSAGRYSIQIPTHLAVRGASRSTVTQEFFTYTGVDANGLPTGLRPLTGVLSPNNEFGQAKDARTVTATNLKPSYQDELTLGFEKAIDRRLNVGGRVTYRQLKQTIDDFCDQSPFDAYAERNHIDTTNYGGFGCASFNPGRANTFLVDYAGTGRNLTTVNLSEADLGFPKAKRTYLALDVFAEHPFSDGWYARVGYTWSRSKGNTEGQTLSDVAQTDVAATQTWDFPQLMIGADGLLPNNRTHQVKAFGFFEVTPEWIVGGNMLAASGRPKNCLGAAPVDLDTGYGSSYHFCDGVLSPRGSQGKLPWDVRFDTNVVYKPAVVKGLALKVDIFNLLNRQTVQTIDEVYQVGGPGTARSATYGRTISYTAPRSVRLTATYDYKF